MKNIKKINNFIACVLLYAAAGHTLTSCSDYLDIVPDNTVVLEDYFANKEKAYQTLAKVYQYINGYHNYNQSPYMFGDEWLEGEAFTETSAGIQAIMIMKGQLNEQNPPMNRWAWLYQGIRAANLFLENIDMTPDLTSVEKNDWKAQVIFLKAFFNFELLQLYGPYVIVDKNIPMDAKPEEMFLRRSKIEDCFNYILALINEAIPNLIERRADVDLGMIDRSTALAIKARILLFRASPFYNGNRQMYSDFLDHEGQPFFPMEENPSKWNEALEAVNAAISFCEQQGKGLYTYEDPPYPFDQADYEANPALKTVLDLRMLIVDQWNKELIWGRTTYATDPATIQCYTGILQLQGGSVISTESTYDNSWNWLGTTYQAMARYYTKNGLPIDEDLSFDRSTMYDIVKTPDTAQFAQGGPDYAGYAPLRGIMQPGVQTINMYLNREPRFYANLGISGGYWRMHNDRLKTMMYGGTPGGWYSSRTDNNWFWAGIGVKKFIHPETKSGVISRQVPIVYPIIRMADLYLMKAEILNEINGPGPDVWNELNKIRRRAGIPNVETVWSDPNLVGELSLNSHTNKDRLRDIIMEERSIEFMFEGIHFYDMYRYKRCVEIYNTPLTGWKGNAFGASEFFKIEIKTLRRFTVRDYLFPIDINERNINSNLIQNPGWR